MPDIETDAAVGRSKNNLMEAIADAFAQVMRGRSHHYSVTLIIDGYGFNGKEFTANVRVMMFDLDEDKHELYQQTEREQEKQAELANAMAIAFYHRVLFEPQDTVTEAVQHIAEHHIETEPTEMRVMTTPEIHDHLNRESKAMGIIQTSPPVHAAAHFPEPGLGSGQHGTGEGKGTDGVT